MRSVREIPAIRSGLRPNSPEEVTRLRALPYEGYLLSAWWRARRNVALRDAGYRCLRCDARRELQVHHVSYDRLGAEEPSDLEVLCRSCHHGVHFDEAQSRIGVYMRIVSTVLAEQRLTDLSDIVEESKVRCAQYALPLHYREFQTAISRLIPRMPFTAPERYAPLLAGKATPFQQFSKAESSAALSKLGIEHAIRGLPETTPEDIARCMTYVEALEDPGGRAEAAAHELAVREGRLDEYLRERKRERLEADDDRYWLRWVERAVQLIELREAVERRRPRALHEIFSSAADDKP